MRWPSELEQRSLASAMTPGQRSCGLPERHHQVHRETEVKRYRRCRQKEPDEDRDHVPDDDGQEFVLRAVQLLALFCRAAAGGVRFTPGE